MSFGKSLLLTCQILGRLVNTFAADEKYPVVNSDKLPIPIQMQLSYKQKNAKLSELEKVSLIDMRNLWTAC